MALINYSFLFDFLRNLYADISYHPPLIKTGSAIIPLRYFLELTYRCNLNCPYCYIGEHRNKEELTTKEWLDLIAQIPRYGLVTLVGGEPFLRKDFSEILHFASKRLFGKVNVVSNGTLLTESAIEDLIKAKIVLLSISIDGYGKTHDINRAKDGIFEKITHNLEVVNRMRKKSGMMVDIKTIVLNNNLEDIYKLYEYCTENKFEYLSVSFLRNNCMKQNAVLLENFAPEFYEPSYDIEPYFDLEHFLDVYERIHSLSKKSVTRIRFSPKFEGGSHKQVVQRIRDFFAPNDPELLKRHPRDVYGPCKYPFSNMMINPSGDVYPCLSFKIGNVREKSLYELFNMPKYKCFRKNLKIQKSFSACQMCCELKVKDLKS